MRKKKTKERKDEIPRKTTSDETRKNIKIMEQTNDIKM